MSGEPSELAPEAPPAPWLPYGRQCLDEDDVQAVVEVLRSDWLTTGPQVEAFEAEFAARVGAGEAVAVSSGTAALHSAMNALAVGPGDEVIVTPMTFAASANCILYQGARPVFADVDPDTLLIDPEAVERLVTPRTRAIVAVDYAGQPCDYAALRAIAERKGVALVADACHSLGGHREGRPVGSLADVSVFSLHPVKPVTSGEGGVVTTDDPELAARLRRFRNHGITTDHRERIASGSWAYEMVELGYNYRLTDIQCALGRSQLRKLDRFTVRRRAIAARYDSAFASVAGVSPLSAVPGAGHAWHLYVVRVAGDRDRWFRALRSRGIGVNVHYLPVYLHPYYRARLGLEPGLCPVAEAAYRDILSLPLFPAMTDEDVTAVVEAVTDTAREAG
ncbi:MAG TPA: UDP-4-amino-4,6-dideoxy-N-acetyl-beta-L-altrosamine transaminase [Gammaproteobacteria bacterium]|nr:UDP-4-amino-4,6-dideoxy-N-acetyl-beta-L-altrosamine transaminase [Gammaproteobacteria bacterium]